MAITWIRAGIRYTATPAPGRKVADFERLHPRDRRGRFRRKPWSILNHHDDDSPGTPAPATDQFTEWGDRAAAIAAAARNLTPLGDLLDQAARDGTAQALTDNITRILAGLPFPTGSETGLRAHARTGRGGTPKLDWSIRVYPPNWPHDDPLLKAQREVIRADDGSIVVEHHQMIVHEKHRGRGLGSAFNEAFENWYIASGADRITLIASLDNGAFTWARAGYDWDHDAYGDTDSTRSAIQEILDLIEANSSDDPAALAQVERYRRLLIGPPETWPTPFELSSIGIASAKGKPPMWPGKAGLLDPNLDGWFGVKYLIPPHDPGETKMTKNTLGPAALERRRRLARLGEAHRQWAATHPGVDESDDTAASLEAEREFQTAIAGIFPDDSEAPSI